MSIKSKYAKLDYDPNFVFRTYNANIPHLSSWIDELISLTQSSMPSASYPTTEQLVQSLKRYDAIFCELIRHNSIFSEPITRLFGKTWEGTFQLLDYAIKCYHRYVKHTMYLQTQAQQLLNDRLASVAANKVKKEEYELERTTLKAHIRNLESEIESLKIANRSLERENSRAKTIINTYIRNDEPNESAWDSIEDVGQDMVTSADNCDMDDNYLGLENSLKDKVLGYKRKDTVDLCRQYNRLLNRLDVDMNAVLTSVIHEENRQFLITQDLYTLMSKHQQVFGKGYWKHGKFEQGDSPQIATVEIGTQVDMKDRYGVVDDLTPDNLDDMVAVISNLPLPPKIPPTAFGSLSSTKIHGINYPYSIRKLMNSFPRVMRIPTVMWTCETIMAIYRFMAITDTKDKMGLANVKQDIFTASVSYATHRYFHETHSIASAADTSIAEFIRAVEYHQSAHKRISLFANQIGMTEKESVPRYDTRDTRVILSIVDICYNCSDTSDSIQQPTAPLMSAASSILSTTNRRGRTSTVSLPMGIFNSNLNSELATPDVSVRDTASVSRQSSTYQFAPVPDTQTISSESVESKLAGVKIPYPSTNLKPDIPRSVGVKVTQALFSNLISNGGLDLMIRANSLPSTTLGNDFIYIDDLIELLLEAWKPIRLHLEEHAKFLFQKYCGSYRILSEVRFASDNIVNGSITVDEDTVVVQLPKALTADLPRRSLRIFNKVAKGNADDSLLPSASSSSNNAVSNPSNAATNNANKAASRRRLPPKKESICDLLSQNNFDEIVKQFYPSIRNEQLSMYFNDGCQFSHRATIKALESIWVRSVDDVDTGSLRGRNGIDGQAKLAAEEAVLRAMGKLTTSETTSRQKILHVSRNRNGSSLSAEIDDLPYRKATMREYFLNVETGTTQWMRPYRPKTFYSNDLEMDAFIAVVLHYDLFLKCPYSQNILNTQPKDFWPNIESIVKSNEQTFSIPASGTLTRAPSFMNNGVLGNNPSHGYQDDLRNIMNSIEPFWKASDSGIVIRPSTSSSRAVSISERPDTSASALSVSSIDEPGTANYKKKKKKSRKSVSSEASGIAVKLKKQS